MAGTPTLLKFLCCAVIFTTTQSLARRERRSDDVTIEALHSMVLEQAQAIETLEAKLTALDNRETACQADIASLKSDVRDLKRRSANMSKEVAFTVRFTANPVTNFDNHAILKFDHIVTNTGDGYNPATGKFMAPVSGSYAFFLNIMSTNDGDRLAAAIVHEGTMIDYVWAAGKTDPDDQGASLVTTHMSAGEQVWVQHDHGATSLQGGVWTTFSGFLVHAD